SGQGALPAGPQSARLDGGPQGAYGAGLPARRDQGMNVRFYLWQRATAAVMAPLVLLHVAVIVYATRRGMTAADILARTRGSLAWTACYGAFVAAAAIHAAIGVHNVLAEWSPLTDRAAGRLARGFGFLLLVLGLGAVAGGVLPGRRAVSRIAAARSGSRRWYTASPAWRSPSSCR